MDDFDFRIIRREPVDDGEAFGRAVVQLRDALTDSEVFPESAQVIGARDRVLARFGPSFRPPQVADVSAEEVTAFLAFRNNQHWTGLERLAPRITADPDALRHALALLVDEEAPLAERLTRAVGMVNGMAKAVATAILHVAYPGRYGVWNSTSEGGLKHVGLWPDFERGASFGERYGVINGVLTALAAEVGTDLWTLDSLWWVLTKAEDTGGGTGDPAPPVGPSPASATQFALERHLQDFLRDNWDHGPFGAEWALHAEPGDPEAGYEYPCGVGRIDLLARHRETRDWLVVELKRGQTSDQTVGQALRYVSWVRRHLAEGGEEVRGLIIAHDADDPLRYALDGAPGVDLKLYEVEFRLRDAAPL